MALPNPPYIGNQIPNGPFSSAPVPATFDRLFGTLVPNIQLDPNPSEPAGPEPWQRPADWLPLPSINGTNEKFAGLVPIYNTDSNFLALSFDCTGTGGGYTVDWGDGTIENWPHGSKAQHHYNWSDIPASTLTSEGFRQVVVTVTPQAGDELRGMNLAETHDNMPNASLPWLDISVSLPNAGAGQSIVFSGTQVVYNAQRIAIYNAGNATDFDEIFSNNLNLQDVTIENASSVESMVSSFVWCSNLRQVSISGLTSLGDLTGMFSNCTALETAELQDLNSADSFFSMFSYCPALTTLTMSGLTAAPTIGIMDLHNSLTEYSKKVNLTLRDLSFVDNLGDIFGNSTLENSVTLTGLTGLTSLDYGFQDANLQKVSLSGLENVTTAIDALSSCYSLKQVTMTGTQNIENWDYCFGDCEALVVAPELDTSGATNLSDMFDYCYALQEVPLYNTSNVEDISGMFYECESLTRAPALDLSSCVDASYLYQECFALPTVPQLSTPLVENFGAMFAGCRFLKTIPALDVSSGTEFDNMFTNCPSLGQGRLNGTSTDISYDSCALSRNAIVAIFNGLANASATINVQGNYGAADLTAGDLTIATGKGWTVLS